MTHSKSIEANLGGTEMAEMLEEVLSMPLCRSYPRQIFLLTDGEVTAVNVMNFLAVWVLSLRMNHL